MAFFPNKCGRCGTTTNVLIGSYFDTKMTCDICCDREKEHPDYTYARGVESEEVRNGNFNYKGVGFPGWEGRVSGWESRIAVGV